MASRIFWVLLAGLAIVTGMVLQDGDRMFSWGNHREISTSTERTIEARVERAVERSIDEVPVVRVDGRAVEVTAETRRALGDAVGRLVKAEADLAVLKIRDGSEEETQAATIRRDQARTEVETVKAQIERQDRLAERDGNAIRDEIRREVREDVRDTVRDAAGN